MNKYLHKLRRSYQRVYIKLYRKITLESNIQQRYEIDAKNICYKLIKNPSSHLLMTPISGKRYIKNDNHSILVTLELNVVNIVNHQYSYTVFLTEKTLKEICNEFDSVIEKQRKTMEDEISSNIKFSLKNLSDKLN